MKTMFIVAMSALVGLLNACGQSSNPATSAAPSATVAVPVEPATPDAAPVTTDPIAGTPTPPADPRDK